MSTTRGGIVSDATQQERCKQCGRTLAQSLQCGLCYALANPATSRDEEPNYTDSSEGDWQEACNPNEGSK